mmetsp:Transcript_111045/g.192374  ORF Transcript_111045/g.192374 Transcript_111045/m.192374 type:complete len:910 (-) Transcript_111045:247-2976(-)
MGQSKTNGDYVALPDKDLAKKAPTQEITWMNLVVAMTSVFFLSCPFIGSSVMIQMFALNGVGSNMCEDGKHYCSHQVLMISNIFILATFANFLFSMPAGVLFDKLGGRLLSLIGNVLIVSSWVAIGFLMVFGNAGYDTVTFPLFGLVMVMSGMASVLKITGTMCISYFFHEYMALVMAALVISSSLEQLQPLGIAYLVIGGYISLPKVCLLHGVVSAVAAIALYWSLPSYELYRKQAEKATGMKQSDNKDGFLRTLKLGAKLLWANMSEHCFTMVTWVFGSIWTGPYLNLGCQYAVYLLGKPDQPSDPVNAIVTTKMGVITIGSSIVVAIGLFPLAAVMDSICNGKFIPVSMAAVTGLSAVLVQVPSWTAQIITCVSGTYAGVGVSLLLANRALAYSPANRLGTFRGLFECCTAFLAMPFSVGIQVILGLLPDPAHMFGKVFAMLSGLGFISLVLFAVYFIWTGLPAAPVVLPEDEAELCLCFGCKCIDEVLHVLELTDAKHLRSLWGSSDPEVQMKLVLHINGQRMVEKMAERDIEELAFCMRSNVAWRRELPSVGNDMMAIPLNMAMIGANFSRLIDNSKLGQGQAKTVEQFQSEVASGRSKFVVDEKDSSRMKRLVSLVALRLFTNRGLNKKMLFQMSEQFPDGRCRWKPQLPGTKKGPNDTLQKCVTSILGKYNMTTFKIHVWDEQVQVSEEESESPSYPGVVTVYRKEHVDAYIVEDSDDALAGIGLPAGATWSAYNEKSKYTYQLEWLTEAEVAEKSTTTDQPCNSQQEQGVAQTSSTDEKGQSKTSEETKVRRPHEIIRSLEARDFSKKLVFLLHMDDVDGLEYWLMNANADHICEAFIDLHAWSDADPQAMMEKFSNLLPNERIASLLQKRHDLKPVVINLLRKELTEVQKKNVHMNADIV